MSRIGIDRVLKFAFELARREEAPDLGDQSNGIAITMPYWDGASKAKRFADVHVDRYHIDIPDRPLPQRPQIRYRRRQQPVRRHPERPRAGVRRNDRHRALGQSQSDARAPVAVRAGAWLRARYRRAGRRQPDRPDLGRRDDARLPRPSRGARRDHRGDRSGARSGSGRAEDPRSRRPRLDRRDGSRDRRSARSGACRRRCCIALGALSSVDCTPA